MARDWKLRLFLLFTFCVYSTVSFPKTEKGKINFVFFVSILDCTAVHHVMQTAKIIDINVKIVLAQIDFFWDPIFSFFLLLVVLAGQNRFFYFYMHYFLNFLLVRFLKQLKVEIVILDIENWFRIQLREISFHIFCCYR